VPTAFCLAIVASSSGMNPQMMDPESKSHYSIKVHWWNWMGPAFIQRLNWSMVSNWGLAEFTLIAFSIVLLNGKDWLVIFCIIENHKLPIKYSHPTILRKSLIHDYVFGLTPILFLFLQILIILSQYLRINFLNLHIFLFTNCYHPSTKFSIFDSQNHKKQLA